MKKEVLYKHSATISISANNISLFQRKLWNFLLYNAYYELQTKDKFEIEINKIKEFLGFNSKNNEYLKKAIRGLISTIVEFNILSKDKDDWEVTSLLSEVSFKRGVCIYSYSSILKQKLYEPNIYAKLNLSLIKLFTSKYALNLYEIIIDFKNISQTPIIPLGDFKKLMGVSDKYSEFKRLKTRVISPAIDEINKLCGFHIDIEYIKESRSIIALKFLFKIKSDSDVLNKKSQKVNSPLLNELIEGFSLTSRQAQNILLKYPHPYIKESLDLIKIKRREGNIKNLPAYTISVLNNDYVPIPKNGKLSYGIGGEIQSLKKDKISKQVGLEIDRSIYEDTISSSDGDINSIQSKDISSKKNKSLQKKAEEYFQVLSKEEQEKLIKRFEDEKLTSPILKNLYEKEGLESPLFRVMFFSFLKS